jgi:hypothetical protein
LAIGSHVAASSVAHPHTRKSRRHSASRRVPGIRAWIATDPSDQRKAALRERIRLYCFTRRARRHGQPPKSPDSAREIYDQLAAADPIVRHQWLFARQWVEESWDEIEAENFDYRKREEKRASIRSPMWTRSCRVAGRARLSYQSPYFGEAGDVDLQKSAKQIRSRERVSKADKLGVTETAILSRSDRISAQQYRASEKNRLTENVLARQRLVGVQRFSPQEAKLCALLTSVGCSRRMGSGKCLRSE